MSFDLSLTPAQHDLVARTHRFAAEVIRPAAPRHDADQEFPWEILEEAAQQGFYNPLFYRGPLWTAVSGVVANEALTSLRNAGLRAGLGRRGAAPRCRATGRQRVDAARR